LEEANAKIKIESERFVGNDARSKAKVIFSPPPHLWSSRRERETGLL